MDILRTLGELKGGGVVYGPWPRKCASLGRIRCPFEPPHHLQRLLLGRFICKLFRRSHTEVPHYVLLPLIKSPALWPRRKSKLNSLDASPMRH